MSETEPEKTFKRRASLAEQRSYCYLLLSTLHMTPPRREFLLDLKKALQKASPLLSGELREIEEILLGAPSIDSLSVELLKDYTRLFLGVKEDYGPPPPYESVYRGEGMLMGTAAQKVLKMYAKYGFSPRMLARRELPDHVGVELAFMSFLCRLEEGFWKSGMMPVEYISAERTFLREHVLAWVPQFLVNVEKHARTGFYKKVASITKTFLNQDILYLEEVI